MTVVEIAVAAGIGAMALGAGVMLSKDSLRDSNSMFIRSGLAIRAAETTDKIARELLTATLTGEDDDRDGVLDSGEDQNRNGRLDADWSLPDAGIETSLTFNRLKDGWLWSDPVTYSVTSGELHRTENGNSRVLCRGVTNLQFLRSGNIIDVSITMTATDRAGNVWTEVSKRRANVRN